MECRDDFLIYVEDLRDTTSLRYAFCASIDSSASGRRYSLIVTLKLIARRRRGDGGGKVGFAIERNVVRVKNIIHVSHIVTPNLETTYAHEALHLLIVL